ncbi:MAG TPA: hypothetical protein VGQ57_07425 [Polyangiaceae bacterium]|jgi:hypothetical protein|nr:hypothetical protein [Polyangiaceae bacterium]
MTTRNEADERDDTLRELHPRGSRALTPEGEAGEETGKPPFDPYRFQANTVPPGMRAELIAAKPEEHPRELMQDTLPPKSKTVVSQEGTEEPPATEPPRRGKRKTLVVLSISFALLALAGLALAARRAEQKLVEIRPIVMDGPKTAVPSASAAPAPTLRSMRAAAARTTAVPAAVAVPSTSGIPAASTVPTSAAVAAPPATEARGGPNQAVAPRGPKLSPRSAGRKPPDLETPLMP